MYVGVDDDGGIVVRGSDEEEPRRRQRQVSESTKAQCGFPGHFTAKGGADKC